MSRGNQTLGLILTTVGGALIGASATYYILRKQYEEQYEERLDEEVRRSVSFILGQLGHSEVVVSDDDPDILAEEMNEAEQPVEIIIEDPTVTEMLAELEAEGDEVEGTKIFGSQEEKPSLEDLAARNQQTQYHKISTPDLPDDKTPEEETELPEPIPENPDISVVSRDIFLENGTEWEQQTLTYFADGGVLNAQGDFVEDHELLIGQGVPRFGDLSEDANVVYVRNKKLELEFEIISDPGNASDFLVHSLQQTYSPDWQR